MKRFLAIIVALILCLALSLSAAAEEIYEIHWEDFNIEDSGVEGYYYSLIDDNMKYWAPGDLEEEYVTDEDLDRNIVGKLVTPDGNAHIYVQYRIDYEGMTLDALRERIAAMGATNIQHFRLNGYDALIYYNEFTNVQVATVATGSGTYVNFEFVPISDDAFVSTAVYVIASIQSM